MNKQIKQSGIIIIGISLLSTILSGCTSPEDTNTQPSDEINLEAKATNMVENLSDGKYQIVFDNFNDEMKSVFPIQDLEAAWVSLIKSYGSYQEIKQIRKTNEQGYEIVYVTCSFSTLGDLDLRFVFDSDKKVAGFQFVPTQTETEYTIPSYVNTSAFSEENVSIGIDPWILPATLSIPKGTGPFPAIVLVHGSGPNDRDETIGPNKPFKDLAWGLASNGFAVIRYDKRTKVYPNEMAQDLNLTPKEEVLDDVSHAIQFLENQSSIEKNQIYVLGHSLGAMLGPQIALENTNIAGLILLAAPARALEDLILDQTEYLANLDGSVDTNETQALELIETQVQKIKTLDIEPDELVLGVYKAYWLSLHNYNQVETAQNLSLPLLFLQGKRDYQVSYEKDFLIWQQLFSEKPTVTLQSYDALNHLFIVGKGKPTNTEYLAAGHVDETIINDIVSWIDAQIG